MVSHSLKSLFYWFWRQKRQDGWTNLNNITSVWSFPFSLVDLILDRRDTDHWKLYLNLMCFHPDGWYWVIPHGSYSKISPIPHFLYSRYPVAYLHTALLVPSWRKQEGNSLLISSQSNEYQGTVKVLKVSWLPHCMLIQLEKRYSMKNVKAQLFQIPSLWIKVWINNWPDWKCDNSYFLVLHHQCLKIPDTAIPHSTINSVEICSKISPGWSTTIAICTNSNMWECCHVCNGVT